MDTRKEENELHLLGSSTEYKQDYAPEVLEAFTNKHPGNDYCVSTALNSRVFARSQDNRTLPRYTSTISPM